MSEGQKAQSKVLNKIVIDIKKYYFLCMDDGFRREHGNLLSASKK